MVREGQVYSYAGKAVRVLAVFPDHTVRVQLGRYECGYLKCSDLPRDRLLLDPYYGGHLNRHGTSITMHGRTGAKDFVVRRLDSMQLATTWVLESKDGYFSKIAEASFFLGYTRDGSILVINDPQSSSPIHVHKELMQMRPAHIAEDVWSYAIHAWWEKQPKHVVAVRYDLPSIAAVVSKEDVKNAEQAIKRYKQKPPEGPWKYRYKR